MTRSSLWSGNEQLHVVALNLFWMIRSLPLMIDPMLLLFLFARR